MNCGSGIGRREAVKRKCSSPLIVALAGTALAGLLAVHFGLRFILTPSLPRGIYRTIDGPLTRGAIVTACLPAGVTQMALERGYVWRGKCPGGAVPLGKLVLAVVGDTVVLSATGIVLNGTLIPNSRPLERDSRGRALEHYAYGAHVIKPSEFWLYSPYHTLSFDSRYFGPISSFEVVSRLIPVWTSGAGDEPLVEAK